MKLGKWSLEAPPYLADTGMLKILIKQCSEMAGFIPEISFHEALWVNSLSKEDQST